MERFEIDALMMDDGHILWETVDLVIPLLWCPVGISVGVGNGHDERAAVRTVMVSRHPDAFEAVPHRCLVWQEDNELPHLRLLHLCHQPGAELAKARPHHLARPRVHCWRQSLEHLPDFGKRPLICTAFLRLDLLFHDMHDECDMLRELGKSLPSSRLFCPLYFPLEDVQQTQKFLLRPYPHADSRSFFEN